jgi:AcrR family transcriptional regulator
MAMDKREALLDAAERAIIDEGFAGASTRRIAHEAGVPLSLVHYHFGGKEGLLVALAERTRQRNRLAAPGARGQYDSAAAHEDAMLQSARRSISGGDAGIRLMVEMTVAALHNTRLRTEVERLYTDRTAALSDIVTQYLREAGRGADSDPQPRPTATLILAAGFGLALQRMLGVEQDTIDDAFEVFQQLLLSCLNADAA